MNYITVILMLYKLQLDDKNEFWIHYFPPESPSIRASFLILYS